LLRNEEFINYELRILN